MLAYLRQYVWSHLPEKIARRQCVREAFIWGGAFLAMGFLGLFWLGKPTTGKIFLAVGAILAATLPIPGLGERVYLIVLRLSATIGFVVARIGLTLVFYLGVTPLGWILRLSGKDPLEMKFKSGKPPAWSERSGPSDPRRYYRLF